MSIERNSLDPSELGYTIKRLSSLPYNHVQMNIVKYVHLVNAGLTMPQCSPFNGVVMVRAQIPSTASGYLLGRHSTANPDTEDMYISVSNGVVTWKIKGVTVTHALEEGIHDYAFVGGYAVYDNKKVDNNQVAQIGVGGAPALVIGGANVYSTASSTNKSYISEVYLYRADVDCYEVGVTPSESSLPILGRYYPISSSRMLNAMKVNIDSITVSAGTGGSSDTTNAGTVTYGVQLDDLKYLFGSKYRDLAAIICEDGGVDSRSGQDDPDDPYQITYDDNTHDFAFDLSGVPHPGTVAPATDYQGELRLGRTPKWDIWQDSVAHGFYIKKLSNNTLKLVYNILRNANGSMTDFLLQWFENYDTAMDATHPPKIVFGDNLREAYIEYHNGQNFQCADTDACILFYSGDGCLDDKSLFYAHNVADLNYNVILGNAVPWNINQADLGDSTRGVYYYVIGGGVALTLFGNVFAITDSIEYDSQSNPVMMCADQPADATLHAQLKTKYQQTGFSGSLAIEYLAPAVRTELITHNNQTPVDAEAVLYCFYNNLRTTVSLSDLLKKTSLTLIGAFNTKIGTSQSITNRRQIMGEKLTKTGSTQKYLAHLLPNNSGYEMIYDSTFDSDPEIMVSAFQECNAAGTELLTVTSSLFALAAIDIADDNDADLVAEHYECMVNVITGLDIGSYSYNVGTRGHAVENFAVSKAYTGQTWYKDNAVVARSTYQSQYTCYAAACPRDFGIASSAFSATALQRANLRFNIHRADNNPFLAKFEGEWIGEASTMALKSTNGTNYYVCRTPGLIGNTTTKQIFNMLARKYTKSGDTWTHVTSAFEFSQKVKLRRKRASASTYENVLPNDGVFNFSNASGSGNQRYVDMSYTVGGTTYTIRCTVSYVETTDPFNGPDGYPVTASNYGSIDYYQFEAYYSSQASDMQDGDTYEISLVD